MTKKVDHISLKKSTIKDKAPLAKDLVDGELAVNIAEDGEKIFLKNTANNIVGFSSDGLLDKKYLSTTSGGTVSGNTEFKGDVKIVYPDSTSQTVSLREVMVDNELAISAALNDLSTKVNNQKTDIDTIKTKECLPLSGGTINGNLTVTGNTEFNGDVKIVYPDSSSQTVSLREVMVKNEKVTAAALNDLNERNDELSAKVTEQKTDIDNLSQKYLPLSGGTMSGNMKYSKTETANNNTKGINAGVISPNDNEITATYSDSIILDKRNKGLKVNYNTLSLTNSEINLHEHSSYMGSVDKDISINAYGLNITNGRINLNQHKGNLGLPNTDITINDGSISLSAATSATTISYDSVTSPKFVKTNATADDILLGDGTTKKVFDFLQTSGGTVSGDTTFTKDVKVVFPNSETPTSLVGAIVSNEKVTSAALNNLNEKVNDHKSDIDNLKAQKNLPLSGGTVTGEATFSGGLKFRYPDVSSTPVSLRDVIADNEEVTAAALNELNTRVDEIETRAYPSYDGTMKTLKVKNIIGEARNGAANASLVLGDMSGNTYPSIHTPINIGTKNSILIGDSISQRDLYVMSSNGLHLAAKGEIDIVNDASTTITCGNGIDINAHNDVSISADSNVYIQTTTNGGDINLTSSNEGRFDSDNNFRLGSKKAINLGVSTTTHGALTYDNLIIEKSTANGKVNINTSSDTLDFKSTTSGPFISADGDVVSINSNGSAYMIQTNFTRGKEFVKLRADTENTMRLNAAKKSDDGNTVIEQGGLRVFTNLFAMPDHVSDISGLSVDTKTKLRGTSVQNLLGDYIENGVKLSEANATILTPSEYTKVENMDTGIHMCTEGTSENCYVTFTPNEIKQKFKTDTHLKTVNIQAGYLHLDSYNNNTSEGDCSLFNNHLRFDVNGKKCMIRSNATKLELYIDDDMDFVFTRGGNSYKLNVKKALDLGLFEIIKK